MYVKIYSGFFAFSSTNDTDCCRIVHVQLSHIVLKRLKETGIDREALRTGKDCGKIYKYGLSYQVMFTGVKK